MKSKPNPVLVWMSILAGLQIFLGGAVTVSIVNDNALVAQIFALAMMAVGAAQGGIQFYVRGQVVPESSVAERVTPDGRVVAGPANDVVKTVGETIRYLGEPPVQESQPLAQVDYDSTGRPIH